MTSLRSPLAPAHFPDPPPIAGLRAATGRAGLYKHDRPDLVLFSLPESARAAGVFTTNAIGSAPTDWCKQVLAERGGRVEGVLVNAGCANSFTGPAGDLACAGSVAAMEAAMGAAARSVLAASTGVIGVVLDAKKVAAQALPLARALAPPDWRACAEAIMTTDTFPKGAGAVTTIGETPVALAGIAKGSGMIAPDMATMLAFVFTDARLPAAVLQALLQEATEHSFNAITVDGDRSTNDCVLLCATGAGQNPQVHQPEDPLLAPFRSALQQVLADLAIQIVRDGEGARKLVKVTVSGAKDQRSAKTIARTICESPLVKTAIAGEDANWGRVVMAVGRAGEPIVRDQIAVRFGDIWVALEGKANPAYLEAHISAYMKQSELEIFVQVGPGPGEFVMHTCDLTKRYIEINGDYRS